MFRSEKRAHTLPTDANIPALQGLVAALAAPRHRQRSPWRTGQLKQGVPVSTAAPSPYATGKLLDWPKPRPSPNPAAGPLLVTWIKWGSHQWLQSVWSCINTSRSTPAYLNLKWISSSLLKIFLRNDNLCSSFIQVTTARQWAVYLEKIKVYKFTACRWF